MRSRNVLVAVSVLSVGAFASAQTNFEIRAGSAGPLRIGMTAAAVYETVGADRVSATDLHIEDTPSPALDIWLYGARAKPTLIAELQADRVWRIRVLDPKFNTADGLHVGSTLADIRAKRGGSIGIGMGEGGTYAVGPGWEVSFDLGRVRSTHPPSTTPVISILVLRQP
jgi:hypothetical protein